MKPPAAATTESSAAAEGATVVADADAGAGAPAAREALTAACLMLSHVARINRFELTLDFADKKTLANLAALFDAMAREAITAQGVDADGLAALRATYRV